MITRLNVTAGDLSIEIEGDSFSEIRSVFLETIANPDVRRIAGLPQRIIRTKVPSFCVKPSEAKTVELSMDGEKIAAIFVKD